MCQFWFVSARGCMIRNFGLILEDVVLSLKYLLIMILPGNDAFDLV